MAFQYTLGSKFQAHWIATGRPLAQGKGRGPLWHSLKMLRVISAILVSLAYNSFALVRPFPESHHWPNMIAGLLYVKFVFNRKTTYMETVSTGVPDKYKEHYLRSKDKAEKWYDVSRHTIAYVKIKKWRYTIHYVKPSAQLLFKSRFPKGGPTCRLPTILLGLHSICYNVPYGQTQRYSVNFLWF